MTEIPIYNDNGIQVNSLYISDTLKYIDGRVSKGEKYYYKGVGIPYTQHHISSDLMSDEYFFMEKSDVFYLGNKVSKKCYKNKFGIFQEKYQPHFTDWLGACGIKELNIFENLYDENGFEKTAIEAFEYVPIDEKNQQYYLKVDYPYGRKKYVTNPNHKKLRDLIDYMITTDWNFPWDKNSISDINDAVGVTDVADLFQSSTLSSKIGTVYSVLYSLFNANQKDYIFFCEQNNLRHLNTMSFVSNSIQIISENGICVDELYKQTDLETYKNIVLNYLVIGKNCGFCGVGSCKRREDDNLSYGEYIKSEYTRITLNSFINI